MPTLRDFAANPLSSIQSLQAPLAPVDDRSELRKGFNRGLANVGSMVQNLGGRAAETVGADQTAQEWYKDAQDRVEQAARDNPAAIGTYRDINGLGSAIDYASGKLGEGVPTIGAAIAGSLALRRPMAALTAPLAERAAARGFLGPLAAQRLALGGGSFATSAALETGEAVGNQQQDPIQAAKSLAERNAVALGKGTVGGALESLVPAGLAGKFGGHLENEAGKSLLRRIATEGFHEGATEAAQEINGELAQKALNDKHQFNGDNVIDAALSGGIVGSTMAAPANLSASGHHAARSAQQAMVDAVESGRTALSDGANAVRQAAGQVVDLGGQAASAGKKAATSFWDSVGQQLPDNFLDNDGHVSNAARNTVQYLDAVRNAWDDPQNRADLLQRGRDSLVSGVVKGAKAMDSGVRALDTLADLGAPAAAALRDSVVNFSNYMAEAKPKEAWAKIQADPTLTELSALIAPTIKDGNVSAGKLKQAASKWIADRWDGLGQWAAEQNAKRDGAEAMSGLQDVAQQTAAEPGAIDELLARIREAEQTAAQQPAAYDSRELRAFSPDDIAAERDYWAQRGDDPAAQAHLEDLTAEEQRRSDGSKSSMRELGMHEQVAADRQLHDVIQANAKTRLSPDQVQAVAAGLKQMSNMTGGPGFEAQFSKAMYGMFGGRANKVMDTVGRLYGVSDRESPMFALPETGEQNADEQGGTADASAAAAQGPKGVFAEGVDFPLRRRDPRHEAVMQQAKAERASARNSNAMKQISAWDYAAQFVPKQHRRTTLGRWFDAMVADKVKDLPSAMADQVRQAYVDDLNNPETGGAKGFWNKHYLHVSDDRSVDERGLSETDWSAMRSTGETANSKNMTVEFKNRVGGLPAKLSINPAALTTLGFSEMAGEGYERGNPRDILRAFSAGLARVLADNNVSGVSAANNAVAMNDGVLNVAPNTIISANPKRTFQELQDAAMRATEEEKNAAAGSAEAQTNRVTTRSDGTPSYKPVFEAVDEREPGEKIATIRSQLDDMRQWPVTTYRDGAVSYGQLADALRNGKAEIAVGKGTRNAEAVLQDVRSSDKDNARLVRFQRYESNLKHRIDELEQTRDNRPPEGTFAGGEEKARISDEDTGVALQGRENVGKTTPATVSGDTLTQVYRSSPDRFARAVAAATDAERRNTLEQLSGDPNSPKLRKAVKTLEDAIAKKA